MAIGDRETSDTLVTFEKNLATAASKDITAGDDLVSTDDVEVGDDLVMTEASNVIVGTSTGTKIGTATTQKLGFFNATPVAQQASIAATDTSTVDATYGAPEAAVLADLRTKFDLLVTYLKSLGFLASP
jgi:hypothetical protein